MKRSFSSTSFGLSQDVPFTSPTIAACSSFQEYLRPSALDLSSEAPITPLRRDIAPAVESSQDGPAETRAFHDNLGMSGVGLGSEDIHNQDWVHSRVSYSSDVENAFNASVASPNGFWPIWNHDQVSNYHTQNEGDLIHMLNIHGGIIYGNGSYPGNYPAMNEWFQNQNQFNLFEHPIESVSPGSYLTSHVEMTEYHSQVHASSISQRETPVENDKVKEEHSHESHQHNGSCNHDETYTEKNIVKQKPKKKKLSDPKKTRPKHVGKACVHCKKAHLACDSARPCKRCVHLGKVDCVDVEHKRRGRPRTADKKLGKYHREQGVSLPDLVLPNLGFVPAAAE